MIDPKRLPVIGIGSLFDQKIFPVGCSKRFITGPPNKDCLGPNKPVVWARFDPNKPSYGFSSLEQLNILPLGFFYYGLQL